MIIEIPGNDRTEEINLPNGQFVLITYLQENDMMSLPDGKYVCPFRMIQLFTEEGGELIGECIEENPHYNTRFYNTVFEHLDEVIEYR